MKEDEYISHEILMSEYANDDFWGRTPYLIGVRDGLIFAYENIKKTIDSGATPDPKVIKMNIENALKQKNMLKKRIMWGGGRMKELKFRVYDKDLGKYLEGCEIDSLMADLCSEGDGRAVIIKQLCPARYIFEQYTGLKDKNGKEIYAGDIVSEHNGDIVGKIIQKPSGEYCIAWIGIFGGSSVLYDELSMCEVIGNINENPGFLVENNGEKD